MAITRTPMVDDDGSGNTGTILNNAWKQEFYGQIDASAAFVNQANTFQADQTIQPNPAGTARLYLIDGSQPADARRFFIANNTQQLIVRAVADAGAVQSTPLTLSRSGDVAIGRDVYEKGRTAAMGHWQAAPYDAGWFAGFTVTTVANFSYTLIGNTIVVNFAMLNGAIPTARQDLIVHLPGGTIPSKHSAGAVGHCRVAAASIPATWLITPSTSDILLRRPDWSNWPTGALEVVATMTIQLV